MRFIAPTIPAERPVAEVMFPAFEQSEMVFTAVDPDRAGAKPTVIFRLNLAYNRWEELGHVRLKQSELLED